MVEPVTRTPRWTRVAYSEAPSAHESPPGTFVSTAAVECWKGTLSELLTVVIVLSDGVPGRFRAAITWVDGSHALAASLDGLRANLANRVSTDILAMRIDFSTRDETTKAFFVARNRIPGLSIRVESSDYARSLGLVEMAYRQSLIGYVDRLGGFRAPLVGLLTTGPLITFSLAANSDIASPTFRTFAVIFIGALALIAYPLIYRMTLATQALALIEALPPKRLAAWRARLARVYRLRYVKVTIGATGALTLGIIGNKIADLIPFP